MALDPLAVARDNTRPGGLGGGRVSLRSPFHGFRGQELFRLQTENRPVAVRPCQRPTLCATGYWTAWGVREAPSVDGWGYSYCMLL